MKGSGLSFITLEELKEIGSRIELKFHVVVECTKILREQSKDWLEHPGGSSLIREIFFN